MANLQTERIASDRETRQTDDLPSSLVRVDPAHGPHSPQDESLVDGPGAATIDDTAEVIEPIVAARLRIQAGQLAGRLQQRRRELDRREAELNARQFQMEAESRTAKLWLRERQHELSEREAELQSARAELQRQLAGISAAEMAAEGDFVAQGREVDAKTREIDVREQALRQREDDVQRGYASVQSAERRLTEKQAELANAEVAALQRIAAAREQSHSLHRRMLKQLDVRREFIERNAAAQRRQARTPKTGDHTDQRSERTGGAASTASHEHRKVREAFTAEQQAFRRRIEADRRSLAARRQKLEEQAARQRAELDERREDLNQRAEANERLHAEILLKHREALELRIVAEQLWLQMGKQLTPQMTQSFAALRGELTSAYRAETVQAAEHRQQLRALADALDQQQQLLRRKQRDMERWATRTRNEIEEQAARLVARERRLDQREAELAAC